MPRKKTRTDREIVDQTNDLALAFLLAVHGRVPAPPKKGEKPKKPKLWKAGDPRGRACWDMACMAQEHLTATDPENSLAELGENDEPEPSEQEKTFKAFEDPNNKGW